MNISVTLNGKKTVFEAQSEESLMSVLHNKTSFFTKRILKISIPIAITSYVRSGLSTLKQIIIPLRLKLSGMSD